MPEEQTAGDGAVTDTMEEAAAAADAESDAVLEKITAPDPEDEPTEAPKGRARDDSGKFAKVETEPEPEAEAPEDDLLKETSDYRKAMLAIEHDGTPMKLFDDMSTQDKIAYGLKRSKNHSDIDRLKSRIVELEKLTGSERPGKASPEAEADDLAALVKPITDIYGEDLSEPMKAFAKTLLEKAQAPRDADIADMKARLQRSEQEAARVLLSDNKLWKDVDLNDVDVWRQVLDYREADMNGYESEQEALQVAIKVLFADKILTDSHSAKLKDHKLRDNGQPTTDDRTQSAPAEKTVEELEDEGLNAIQDGDTEKRDKIALKLGRHRRVSSAEAMQRTMSAKVR